MWKAIRDDRACFVFEDVEKARDFLTALSAIVSLYTEDRGTIYEIRDIEDITITIQFKADIKEFKGGGRNYEGVRVK